MVLITSGVGASADNPCGVVAPVFDGRRRYNIELTKVKDTTVKMDNGLYKGKALLCEMKYHQLAGFKPKIIKDNESFPKINAWVATFPSAIAGPQLCRAAAGVGRHAIRRRRRGGDEPEGGRPDAEELKGEPGGT